MGGFGFRLSILIHQLSALIRIPQSPTPRHSDRWLREGPGSQRKAIPYAAPSRSGAFVRRRVAFVPQYQLAILHRDVLARVMVHLDSTLLVAEFVAHREASRLF